MLKLQVFGNDLEEVTELPTIGSNQKSYYGKAKTLACVDEAGEVVVYLLSYDAVVAMVRNGKFYRLWQSWSATSAKHINSFRAAFRFPKISKKDWLNLPCYVYNDEKQMFEQTHV